MPKTIYLPVANIKVNLYDNDPEIKGAYGGGTISSTLAENRRRTCYNAACNTLENMILACAVAGIDIETPAFLEAVYTVVDKISNEYGD